MEIDLPGRFRADAYKGDYRMALYEHTVMTRQDISAQQAEALNDTIKDLIVQGGGSVAKIEYWGLRNLTYRCLLYTSPSPRDRQKSRMPSSA